MKSHCVKDVKSWAYLVGDDYHTKASFFSEHYNYGCIYEYFCGVDWMLFLWCI